ncbi:MAG: ABC transporter ATP-binding protein [Acidimicrobiales bacterium]
MDRSRHWSALIGLLTPHKGRVAVMSGVLSIAGLLPLAGPLIIAVFIDDAAAGAGVGRLVFLAGLYVGVGLARQLMAMVVAWTATDLAWRVTNELRSTLTRHVLGLDLGFHRSTSPGELVSRVDGDVTALSEFISNFAAKALAALVTLVGLLVVVYWRSWPVGIVLTVYLCVAVGTLYVLRDRAVAEAASEQAATGRMLGEVEERLSGADDLRSNGGGSHAVATFQRASANVLASALSRERQGVGLWIISNAVFVTGGLLVLAVDAALLSRGTITLGTAFLLFQYTQILRTPLDQLSDETERVQRAAGGMTRTLALLTETSVVTDTGTQQLPDGSLGVRLDSVSFHYADEEVPSRVLSDVSFSLGPGRSLGVLGRTGSGKTTLARLLLRLVDPAEGTISLGGVPLDSVAVEQLRERTGVVSQDVHLFAASIRDNLTLFDDGITDDEVRAALDALDLLDWIEGMPGGLETTLGPGGAGLSGGEGQLVALARLFLRSPDFILLDEASSRIDPVTEDRVIHAIDRLLQGRTSIVIAHRLSTVARLDEILVLDDGEIVEHGRTEDLRGDPNSRYSQLLAVGSHAAVDEVLS